jgi:hypothetical protein
MHVRPIQWFGLFLLMTVFGYTAVQADARSHGNYANAPYPGPSPHAIPGTIEAENFDSGGEGDSYHDTTSTNQGGQYRTSDAVDVETNGVGNYRVGYMKAGEWLEYTVDVTQAGTYLFSASIAAPTAGGTFHLEVDGVNVSGTLVAPNTGGWATFQNVKVSDFALTTGQHVLRFVVDQAGSNTYFGNLDRFSLTIAGGQSYYNPSTSNTVPGTIEAEDFDTGGEAIAFKETTLANEGNSSHRGIQEVDIQDYTSGGVTTTWISHFRATEWLEYTLNVQASAYYDLYTTVSSLGTGGTLGVYVDGVSIDQLQVPDTGSWNTTTSLVTNNVYLEEGSHVIRFKALTEGTNGYLGNFDEFTLLTARRR